MRLSIWIRTHSQRLYLAERLVTMCNTTFGISAHVLNTGDASDLHTYKFAISCAEKVSTSHSDYILMLEDDILLTPTSRGAVQTALDREDPHNWYTVDTTTNVLDCSMYVPEFGYILSSANHISYSGAVLLRRDILQDYLEVHLLSILDQEFPNFDVRISTYLLRHGGYIHLRPGHFTQNLVQSSVNPLTKGRVNHRHGEMFEYDGPLT